MDQVHGLLRKVFRGIGSSRAKRYLTLLERGEWAQLQEQTLPDPRTYQNAIVFRKDAMATDIIRKLVLPGNSQKCEEVAIAKFWAAEAQCKATNDRLARFDNGGPYELSDLRVEEFLGRWRKIVRRVLGPLPHHLVPRFSGGSTLSDSAAQVTIPDKLTSKPTMYQHGLWVATHIVRGTPFERVHQTWTPVTANRFFTVPKSSKEFRGCCVEASVAVSLQLAIGKEIEGRFERYYKVDLRETPSYHRWLASIASRHGTFATIDLSSASDTVAWRLVRLLLPPMWYDLLDSLRARKTDLKGRQVMLEKFSSMGNGFTFPLETLLFRTLAEALGSNCASVFGDDIIVESEHADAMIAALRYFGFTPNSRKTFCDGPFRESCGGDFFEGTPVRAYFIKELPCEPQHWVMIANGLRRWDPELKVLGAAWRYCIDQLPKGWRSLRSADWRCCPENQGEYRDLADLAIYDPETRPVERKWRCPTSGAEGVLPCWRVARPLVKKFNLDAHFRGSTRIWARNLGCEAEVSTRGAVEGYKPSWLPIYGTGWLPEKCS